MTRCEGVLYPDLRVLGGEAALARPPIPVACPDSGGTDASACDGFAWLAGIPPPPPVRILDAGIVWGALSRTLADAGVSMAATSMPDPAVMLMRCSNRIPHGVYDLPPI